VFSVKLYVHSLVINCSDSTKMHGATIIFIHKYIMCVCVCVCGNNAVFFLTLNLLVYIVTAVLQKCYQSDDVFSTPYSRVKNRPAGKITALPGP